MGCGASTGVADQSDMNHAPGPAVNTAVILLGAMGSGKSTFYKQLQYSQLSPDEREDFQRSLIPVIHSNVCRGVEVLHTLSNHLIEAQPEKYQLAGSTREACRRLPDFTTDWTVKPQYVRHLHSFWRDPLISHLFYSENARSDFNLFPNLSYFMHTLPKIASPSFSPAPEDIFNCYIRTTGIAEDVFQMETDEKSAFKVYDLGGGRLERMKWVHTLSDRTIVLVLFFVDIAGHDALLYEDERMSKIAEALNIWTELVSGATVEDKKVFLIFNKIDEFKQRMQQPSISQPSLTATLAHTSLAPYPLICDMVAAFLGCCQPFSSTVLTSFNGQRFKEVNEMEDPYAYLEKLFLSKVPGERAGQVSLLGINSTSAGDVARVLQEIRTTIAGAPKPTTKS